jgi:ADP-ribose pyrophosphatase YjhB (NUDIX family)
MTITSTDIHGTQYEVPIHQLQWRPAAYAIVVHGDRILLTKQHDSFHLPGGGMELGETPEHTVVREVKEETGVKVTDPQLVKCVSGFFTYQDGKKDVHVQSILLYYVCTFAGGRLSMDHFMEDEKLVGDMPEWIPLNTLRTIRAGSTVDWPSFVEEILETAN